LNEIQIPSIAISGIGQNNNGGRGSTGLPDTDKAYFDFDIKELVSTAKDVNDFLPKETILNSINLHRLMLKELSGTINNFSTDLILKVVLVLQNEGLI
jgi:hypothetical protein